MDLMFGFVELAGGKMALCRFASAATLLIGIGVSGVPALAQHSLQPTQAGTMRAPVGDQQEALRPPRSIGADDVTGTIAPGAQVGQVSRS